MTTTTAPTATAVQSVLDDLARLGKVAPIAAAEVVDTFRSQWADRTWTAPTARRLILDMWMRSDVADLKVQFDAAEYAAGRDRSGYARAASYLVAIPAEARSAICSEARIASNMSGGRWADHVEVLCRGNWARYVGPEADATRRALSGGTYTEPNLPGSGI